MPKRQILTPNHVLIYRASNSLRIVVRSQVDETRRTKYQKTENMKWGYATDMGEMRFSEKSRQHITHMERCTVRPISTNFGNFLHLIRSKFGIDWGSSVECLPSPVGPTSSPYHIAAVLGLQVIRTGFVLLLSCPFCTCCALLLDLFVFVLVKMVIIGVVLLLQMTNQVNCQLEQLRYCVLISNHSSLIESYQMMMTLIKYHLICLRLQRIKK